MTTRTDQQPFADDEFTVKTATHIGVIGRCVPAENARLADYHVLAFRQSCGDRALNDEAVAVKATDIIVAPPQTRIHYFGRMEIVLTVSPRFDERNERHVRFVAEDESPYAGSASPESPS